MSKLYVWADEDVGSICVCACVRVLLVWVCACVCILACMQVLLPKCYLDITEEPQSVTALVGTDAQFQCAGTGNIIINLASG